jgi:hypothetical protein
LRVALSSRRAGAGGIPRLGEPLPCRPSQLPASPCHAAPRSYRRHKLVVEGVLAAAAQGQGQGQEGAGGLASEFRHSRTHRERSMERVAHRERPIERETHRERSPNSATARSSVKRTRRGSPARRRRHGATWTPCSLAPAPSFSPKHPPAVATAQMPTRATPRAPARAPPRLHTQQGPPTPPSPATPLPPAPIPSRAFQPPLTHLQWLQLEPPCALVSMGRLLPQPSAAYSRFAAVHV